MSHRATWPTHLHPKDHEPPDLLFPPPPNYEPSGWSRMISKSIGRVAVVSMTRNVKARSFLLMSFIMFCRTFNDLSSGRILSCSHDLASPHYNWRFYSSGVYSDYTIEHNLKNPKRSPSLKWACNVWNISAPIRMECHNFFVEMAKSKGSPANVVVSMGLRYKEKRNRSVCSVENITKTK